MYPPIRCTKSAPRRQSRRHERTQARTIAQLHYNVLTSLACLPARVLPAAPCGDVWEVARHSVKPICHHFATNKRSYPATTLILNVILGGEGGSHNMGLQ